MEKFKYFVIGYPSDSNAPIYALYQPVLDCFLNVTESLELAQTIKLILSSRYDLHVCCISKANNYKINLIDNEICENWTIGDRNTVSLTSYPTDSPKVATIKNLQPTGTNNWNIDQEKQWIFLCIHWILFFKQFEQFTYYRDDLILNGFLELESIGSSQIDSIHNLKKQTMKLLYLGLDFTTTDQAIINLIKSNKLINKFWQDLTRDR